MQAATLTCRIDFRAAVLLSSAHPRQFPAAAPRGVRCMSAGAGEGKRKMVRIGTHNGAFHCDEAFGCFMLRQTAGFRDAEVVRSRDPEVLKELDVVIDVGGVYDASAQRFDHHQKGFTEVFGHGFTTKLSSAGLVYKHYGKEIVRDLLGLPADSPNLDKVYLAVYKNFVEGLDAIDNGIMQYPGDEPARYISNTGLSSRVGRLNPRWNEDNNDGIAMERFLKAVELTGVEFKECVDFVGNCWLPARVYVEEAINGRHKLDPSGEIIALSTSCPWKEHLYEIEDEMKIEKPIKFCLFEQTGGGGWRVQAVSVAPSSFENRKSLPWRGLRDDALSEASSIPGGVFVHMGGFIGGNKTYEGALEMAKKALTLEE
mmetsp:Transcript_20492/g.51607  ORF Transcript_20492/g.51607 Transcript_20492/m.51607 type:complete len:371 (+) Transcript_20492:70-1182(+)